MVRALTWALKMQPDPAALKWPVAVLATAFFGLLLFAIFQYQTSERRWGMKLVLGLLGGATLVGLGTSAFHWLTGVLYGVGYLLTWLVWVLTGRWSWWRRALARGLTAGLTLGPWLWLGATEKESLGRRGAWGLPHWLLTPNALVGFWLLLGVSWLLVVVGGWGCWRWPLARPGRRRWLVAAWAVLGVLGLNWYAAGRVDLLAICRDGQHWCLRYVLVSRPGSQWYRGGVGEGTPLEVAARSGQTETARVLLAAGADVMTKNKPVHHAAASGRLEMIRLLLAAGADVNGRDDGAETPLHWAVRQKAGAETIRLLLAAGADVNATKNGGETPLYWAVEVGDAEALRLLLAAGADIKAKPRYRGGRTLLHCAANRGDAAAIRLLLAAGADVNAKDEDGQTPLHRTPAALPSMAEALELLLGAGADAKARDNLGRTPLHWAAHRGDAPAIQRLLAAGADVNAKTSDRSSMHLPSRMLVRLAASTTPLHVAATFDGVAALQALLAAGADVNATANDGRTPLQQASRWGSAETVRLLLAAGAKVNERSEEGATALDLAATDASRKLLRDAGGKTSVELDAEKQAPAK